MYAHVAIKHCYFDDVKCFYVYFTVIINNCPWTCYWSNMFMFDGEILNRPLSVVMTSRWTQPFQEMKQSTLQGPARVGILFTIHPHNPKNRVICDEWVQ